MTMSAAMLQEIEARGLDIELMSGMGFDGIQRDGGEALVIPFHRDGRIVRRKYRTLWGDKRFWADKGGLRCAWNEDVLRDDSLIGQALVITEGELDAVAAIQCGFVRTISVPDGAPQEPADDPAVRPGHKWVEDIKALLARDRVSEIILAVDGDLPGAALLQDLSVLLGRFRCKFLTYPEGCKDLNDILREHGVKGVGEALHRATWLKVDGVYRLAELPPLPAPVVYPIGFDLLGENYRMRLGDFAVVTGVPGLGKTTLVTDLVCRVVKRQNVRVAWASFEQSPQRDHRSALRSWFCEAPSWKLTDSETEAADAWIDRYHRFMVPSEDEDVTLDWVLDRMEIAVVRHDVRIVVIDPWNEMDHVRERDESLTQYTGRAIKALRRFAKTFQVHLIVVAHPAKLQKVDGKYKAPTLYDISDSAHWYNKCDVGIIIHRENKTHTDVKVQKSRYHHEIGKPGEVRMTFNAECRRFYETERLA